LKLATLWEFRKVRELAIKKLDADKDFFGLLQLIVALDYDVPQWKLAALRFLATKTEFREEWASKIGIQLSLNIATLQGCVSGFKHQRGGGKDSLQKDVSQAEIDVFIKKIFPDMPLPGGTSSSGKPDFSERRGGNYGTST
jgi:hypothetical protein